GVAPPVNVPPASLAPVYVTLETDSPPPVRVFARSAGVIPWARSVVAIAALADGANPRASRIAKDAKMTIRRMVPSLRLQSDRSQSIYNTSLRAVQDAARPFQLGVNAPCVGYLRYFWLTRGLAIEGLRWARGALAEGA